MSDEIDFKEMTHDKAVIRAVAYAICESIVEDKAERRPCECKRDGTMLCVGDKLAAEAAIKAYWDAINVMMARRLQAGRA